MGLFVDVQTDNSTKPILTSAEEKTKIKKIKESM